MGTRQVEDGQVKLRKVVKTETVNQPVQLRRETVVIDRIPADSSKMASSENAFQEGETVIQLHHEEPVVQTEIVSAGQIVAQTKSDVKETTIQRQVRSEDVVVDKGNSQNVIVSENVSTSQAAGGGGDVGGQSMGGAGAITEPATLTGASDPGALAGRSVQLNNVKVDQASGRMLCIKDEMGRPLYIRLSAPLENIHAGDSINITGTARRVSSTSATSMGDLSDQMMQSLKGQQLYVDAQSVAKN